MTIPTDDLLTTEAQRLRSDAVLEAVSLAAERFLRSSDWQRDAESILGLIGRAIEASRVYVFENRIAEDDGSLRAHYRFEWIADGIAPQIDLPELQEASYEGGFERWGEVLSSGGLVEGQVEDFPEGEQELLRAQDIRSLVVVPIFVEDEWWGFVGFDECKVDRTWSAAERQALRTAASTVSAAIQRDRSDAALRAREVHYRRLVETSPYPVFVLGSGGRVVEINPAGEELIARRSRDVLGQKVAELIHPHDLDGAIETYERLRSGPRPSLEFEARILRPSGEARLVHVAATLIRSGDEVGIHGIARDVTDERAREVELRRAERLASVGTLIGGVAHELNNPLTSIRGLSELLLDGEQQESRRDMLAMVAREADRTARIVEDLRRLAQRTQGGSSTRRVDLEDIVRHVLKMRSYELNTHGIRVETRLAGDLPLVHGDDSQLEQVVLNLVVNAEHALDGHPSDRTLTIRTSSSDAGPDGRRGVRLEVADDGPGIDPAHLGRLFDPFWTTKSPDRGTGLGLSLVHKIVTEHGGVIEVESALGAGARFVVRLPAAEPVVDDEAPAADPEASAPAPSGTLDILVVDDERGVRQVLLHSLGRHGHQVDLAASGAEALRAAAARSVPYDIVLCDLRMAGMSGEELLLELRGADPAYRGRFVFLTGDIHACGAGSLIEQEGIPVLQKPFDLRELEDLVRRVAAG